MKQSIHINFQFLKICVAVFSNMLYLTPQTAADDLIICNHLVLFLCSFLPHITGIFSGFYKKKFLKFQEFRSLP